MSPRIVPYTWLRHLVPAATGGAVGLVAWWSAVVVLGSWRSARSSAGTALPLSAEAEGVVMLVVVAAAISVGQVLLEGRFERTTRRRRFGAALAACVFASSCSAGSLSLFELAVNYDTSRPISSMGLSWHVVPWMLAGGAVGFALIVLRGGRYIVEWAQLRWNIRAFDAPPEAEVGHLAHTALHVLGGPLAGACAALVWYSVGISEGGNFLAAAAGCWTLGAVSGGLAWVIPDRLYRGWVRVLRGARPGWRVPVDHEIPALRERFVGCFPAGMDLHLPNTDGVAELHVSIVAKVPGQWAARGLSRQRVRVQRPLEWMELTYDPSLPAPLEAPLMNGDRIFTGDTAELEFVVVSREALP